MYYSREKHFHQESPKPRKSHRNTPSFSSSLLDEICRSIDEKPHPSAAAAAAAFSKVDKWISDNDAKTPSRRRPKSDNAAAVFPDTSTSGAPELPAARPKPIRTSRRCGGEKDSYLFDEYEEHERRRGETAAARDDHLLKSKSRAMRIYTNLKKMKQPISPGAKLTSFFASIFSGLHRKKSKSGGGLPPAKTLATCSTKLISSNKIAHNEIEIERDLNLQLDLARALVDRDKVMPRGRKSQGDGRPPLPPNAFQNRGKSDLMNKSRYKIYDDNEEEEDAISESSSDLFELELELDNSSLFAIKDRLCDELPVYETTYFDNNRRIFR